MIDSLSRTITYIPVEAVSGTDSDVFTLTIQQINGASLEAEPGTGSKVFARLHGVGSYVDIATSPIALGSNSLAAYDFLLRPVITTGRVRELLGIGVVQGGSAGWKS